mgnify:CR=1 FL=1
MLKILCGVMNESVIHRYAESDPGGSYTGVCGSTFPKLRALLYEVLAPFKTIEIHPFFVRE